MLWVAAAGPGANLAMLLFWAALAKMAWLLPINFFSLPMARMAEDRHVDQPRADGAQPLSTAAARRWAHRRQPVAARCGLALAKLERFGFPILLLLLFTGVLGSLLMPVMRLVGGLVEIIFQLPS
jgi:hypothetical protein